MCVCVLLYASLYVSVNTELTSTLDFVWYFHCRGSAAAAAALVVAEKAIAVKKKAAAELAAKENADADSDAETKSEGHDDTTDSNKPDSVAEGEGEEKKAEISEGRDFRTLVHHD